MPATCCVNVWWLINESNEIVNSQRTGRVNDWTDHKKQRWKLFYRLQVVFQWRRWVDSGKDRPVHTAARSCTVDAARRPSSVTESVRQRRTPSLSRRSISPLRCPNTTCTNHITHARTPQAQSYTFVLHLLFRCRKIVLLSLRTSASLLVHNFENRGYLL